MTPRSLSLRERSMRWFVHRAGSVEGFGCTLDAARRAFDLGLDIEFDVRACKDGLVCTHYDKLGTDSLSAYSLAEVRQFALSETAPGRIEAVHRPFLVDGGNAARIPTLVEILTLAANNPKKPTILLDIKEEKLREEIEPVVNSTGTSGQVIYGIHKAAEIAGWEDLLGRCLGFCGLKELQNFADSEIAWIRLWQEWLTDDLGELTDPDGLIGSIKNGHPGRRCCIMTGSSNLVSGGVTTSSQIACMAKRFSIDGFIVNDPSIILQANYLIGT